jgi:hypothetical protein
MASDEVIFFADEAGSWQVGVDWRTVFPAYFAAYFGCLAEAAAADEFAKPVDRAPLIWGSPWDPALGKAPCPARRNAGHRPPRSLPGRSG